jgi:hypothetical protein
MPVRIFNPELFLPELFLGWVDISVPLSKNQAAIE